MRDGLKVVAVIAIYAAAFTFVRAQDNKPVEPVKTSAQPPAVSADSQNKILKLQRDQISDQFRLHLLQDEAVAAQTRIKNDGDAIEKENAAALKTAGLDEKKWGLNDTTFVFEEKPQPQTRSTSPAPATPKIE